VLKLARAVPVLLLLACALFVSEARADTVVITSGSASIHPLLGGPFTLGGGGLTASGGVDVGLQNGSLFSAGQTASLLSFTVGGDIDAGSAVVNGVSFPNVFYGGFLRFDGSLPALSGPLGAFTLNVPFSFTGSLQGCLHHLFVGPCAPGSLVFDTLLTGQGMATVELLGFELAGGRHYEIRNVTYNFGPAAATPEPATLLLLGTGLAGIGAAVRKRRQKAVDSSQ
jgi:PEP-CTERM motif